MSCSGYLKNESELFSTWVQVSHDVLLQVSLPFLPHLCVYEAVGTCTWFVHEVVGTCTRFSTLPHQSWGKGTPHLAGSHRARCLTWPPQLQQSGTIALVCHDSSSHSYQPVRYLTYHLIIVCDCGICSGQLWAQRQETLPGHILELLVLPCRLDKCLRDEYQYSSSERCPLPGHCWASTIFLTTEE